MVTVVHADRLFSPAFIALTLSELAYFLCGGLLIAVTPFFVTGPVGSDDAGVGLVFGSFGITTLILRPFAGRLADRRGRRPMLLIGALLMSAVMLGHLFTTDLALIVGLRLLYGVAEALYFVAALATLADVAPPDRVGEAISYNSLALYVGVALGPLAGELLMDAGGFTAAWGGGFVLGLIAFLVALLVPESGVRQPAGAADAKPAALLHRAAIVPGLALFGGVAAMSAYFVLAGRHAERQGIDAWSLTFLLFGGLVVALRLVFAKLPDRVPPLRLAAAALGCSAIGLLITAIVPGIAGLVAGTVGLAIGVAFMTPALFSAIFARVPPEERGAASGTASLFIDLGFTGGPFVIGFVSGQFGFPAAFAVAGAFALAGTLVTLLSPRREPRPAAVA